MFLGGADRRRTGSEVLPVILQRFRPVARGIVGTRESRINRSSALHVTAAEQFLGPAVHLDRPPVFFPFQTEVSERYIGPDTDRGTGRRYIFQCLAIRSFGPGIVARRSAYVAVVIPYVGFIGIPIAAVVDPGDGYIRIAEGLRIIPFQHIHRRKHHCGRAPRIDSSPGGNQFVGTQSVIESRHVFPHLIDMRDILQYRSLIERIARFFDGRQSRFEIAQGRRIVGFGLHGPDSGDIIHRTDDEKVFSRQFPDPLERLGQPITSAIVVVFQHVRLGQIGRRIDRQRTVAVAFSFLECKSRATDDLVIHFFPRLPLPKIAILLDTRTVLRRSVSDRPGPPRGITALRAGNRPIRPRTRKKNEDEQQHPATTNEAVSETVHRNAFRKRTARPPHVGR